MRELGAQDKREYQAQYIQHPAISETCGDYFLNLLLISIKWVYLFLTLSGYLALVISCVNKFHSSQESSR